MRDLLVVGKDAQTFTLVVALAGLVPDDGERHAVVGDTVQAEPVPRVFRQQRVEFDDVVGSRPQTDQSADQ